MSRITISDLAIDSNSFLNEVAETEAAFVNGGRGLSKDKILDSILLILGGYLEIGKLLITGSNSVLTGLLGLLQK